MAGIGVDISEVINELGTQVSIIRDPVNLTEFIMYELDNSSSRAFYREYVLYASFVHDSVIVHGDVLFFDNAYYMVAHKTSESFENSIVEYMAVLYRSNFPPGALILSPTQTQDPVSFAITQDWAVKKATPFGLIYKSDFFTLLEEDISLGRDLGVRLECVVPSSYGVQERDRIQISPTEFYRIQDIEKFRFPGLCVLTLVDDERPAYVP